MNGELQVGDLCFFRASGPTMCVVEIVVWKEEILYRCGWFNQRQDWQLANFPLTVLEKVVVIPCVEREEDE